MARAALQLSASALAHRADIKRVDLIKLENGHPVSPEITATVRKELELDGIEFIGTDCVRFVQRAND